MQATTAQHASEIRLPALQQVGMIYIHACWAVARMLCELTAIPNIRFRGHGRAWVMQSVATSL